MKWLNTINQLLVTVCLLTVITMSLFAIFLPAKFGKWLQQIDHTRYEYLDHDYTDQLE